MRKNLFVYGTAHGRLVESTGFLGETWRVPIVDLSVMPYQPMHAGIPEPDLKVATYKVYLGIMRYPHHGPWEDTVLRQFCLYVLEEKHDDLHYGDVLDAALLALGVTQR